jgi:proteasome lid subunit RPN8/RPN11
VQDYKREAVRHAEEQYPKESAGLVVNGSYFPCRNIADRPEESFVISPVDYGRAMCAGVIEGVVHSHPQGTPVSHYDRKACSQSKIPWYIYSVPNKEWLTVEP